MRPICRSLALRRRPVRFGMVVGFCSRQAFQQRGPRRNISTCSASAETSCKVLDDRDIVVVMAGTGFEVTYRKDGQLPMLVATDQLRGGVTSSKAKFLAQAWKVAYQKAKTLGWLAR